MSFFAEAVEKCPMLDGHCHAMVREDDDTRNPPFESIFSEASPEIAKQFAPSLLSFKVALRDLAKLYNCQGTLDSVLESRKKANMKTNFQKCLDAGNIRGILLDDGFMTSQLLPIEWHNQVVRTERILRIETVAENALQECCNSFQQETCSGAKLVDSFRENLTAKLNGELAAPGGTKIVGLKSVVAYRTGLAIDPEIDEGEVAEHLLLFMTLRERKVSEGEVTLPRVRLNDRPLNNFVLHIAFEWALGRNLPIQLHTGFGDTDLFLPHANPILLRPLLESAKFPELKLVLLHASYPYAREAGFMSSAYRNVYVDFGLAIPLLSPRGQLSVLEQLFELTPYEKIMFSSDGRFYPESYYLAAVATRRAMKTMLGASVEEGHLDELEAIEIVRCVFYKNVIRLYNLDWVVNDCVPESEDRF